MRLTSFCLTRTATFLFALWVIHPSSAQIVGCDGEGIDCDTGNKDPRGICQPKLTKNGIGVVSFDSSITLDGPLTWTLTISDETSSGEEYSDRSFWFGTPPSLNVSDISAFGGCSLLMGNLTSYLQLPPGFTGFGSFGCGTVMGESCARDLVSHVRSELVDIDQAGTLSGHTSPCALVQERLQGTPLPDSCEQLFNTKESVPEGYLFQNAVGMFSNPHRQSFIYVQMLTSSSLLQISLVGMDLGTSCKTAAS